MRYSAVLIASVAGLASQAIAQNFSLELVPSTSFVPEGGSFTLSVYGDADVGTHILGGAFALDVSAPSYVDSMTWTPASWSAFNTDDGYDAGNGNYNQVIFGQLVIPGLFPPAAGSDLGQLIGTFQVAMIDNYAQQIVLFSLVEGTPFTLETIDSVTGQSFRSDSGNLTLGTVRIGIPSPSGIGVFGAAGLFASRRRR